MLWRIRATLPDRPGSLAVLARECGDAGVDIRAVQIFTGIGNGVTDELVVRVPEGWGEQEIVTLVRRSGAGCVSTLRCTEAAVTDQPTRYVEAARAVLATPESFPEVVARLFDADVEPVDRTEDVMELSVGSAVVQVRRTTPFTAVEHARGAAMAGLVSEVLDRVSPPRPETTGAGVGPEYVVSDDTVTALVAGTVAGRASVAVEQATDRPWLVDLWVDAGWHRRGIGTKLLIEVARQARARGAEEILLSAPAESRAVLPMLLAAGLRGRIRMAGETLTVKVALTDMTVASEPVG